MGKGTDVVWAEDPDLCQSGLQRKSPAGRPDSHSHHRWQLVLRAHTTLLHLQQQTNRVQMSYGNKDKASFAVKLSDTLHLKATIPFDSI